MFPCWLSRQTTKAPPDLLTVWNRKMQHKALSQPIFLKLSYFNASHIGHFVGLITSLLPILAIVSIPSPKYTFKHELSGRHNEVLNLPSEICDAIDCINVCYFFYETRRNGNENKRNKHKHPFSGWDPLWAREKPSPLWPPCNQLLCFEEPLRKAWLSHVFQSAPVEVPLKGQWISTMLLTGRLKCCLETTTEL